MFKIFLTAMVVAMSGCATISKEVLSTPNTISISRYFSVKTCYTGQACTGPVARNLEKSNIELIMDPYSKGKNRGYTAFDENKIFENGVPFKSEIRITKTEGKEGYHVYIMLRSGPSLKRNGKIKTFSVKSLSRLSETIVADKPINFEGGTLQVELILGPPLSLSK